ncbi:MAG: hypothetical protein CSA66_02760 [Proteobacteria bacterium]|nr:MAG: hypothetical protein CSA66_02760 [Pseudomonadota bacterium]
MDIAQTALDGALLPAAVAAGVALAARPWRGSSDPIAPRVSAAALTASWLVACFALFGLPSLPPADATDWAFWLGALAPLPALPGIASRAPLRLALVIALGAAVAWALIAPLAAYALSPVEAFAWALAVTASVVYLERVIASSAERVDPRGAALGLTLLAAGVASALILSGTASLAQRVGGLAAGLGALCAIGLRWPRAARVAAGAPVIAVVLGASSWSGFFYAELSPLVLALLLAAPLALVAARPLAAGAARPLVALTIPALLMVVPVGAANGVAASLYFTEPEAAAPTVDTASDPDANATDGGYDYDYGY